jgi:hypothetical protein
VGERAELHRRGLVGAGTRRFAGVGLVLFLCLVVVDATGVGASGVAGSRSPGSAAHAPAAVASTNRQVGSHYLEVHDAAPPSTPPTSTPPTASPLPPTASEDSTPSAATAPPPPPQPAALPARGTATAYGCAAALAYLAAYSAPGFTFQCPGSALGHQAMTCINEPGVCDNEHLIAIADPCAAAYMNEASNSWVLTGASDSPIDPYGACT